MKKLYTLICAGLLISFTSSAQYTSTYTAQVPGNWDNGAGPSIWSANPPQFCNNCLVNLTPAGGGIINMNSRITLNGNSKLVVGSGVTLMFNNSGNTLDLANPQNFAVVLSDVGINSITWVDGTATINAANAGIYDGVLAATTNVVNQDYTFLKEIGNSPVQFHVVAPNSVTITNNNAALLGTTFSGPNTLNNFGSLPIILTSFTANLDEDVVDLAWTTSSEVNADHIAIQRSVDAGAHWSTIATKAASAKDSYTATNYTYTDAKPAAGASEYRLQLVDKDGKVAYSQVKTVRNGLIGAVRVFPNPAHDYVNVTLGGSSTESLLIRLYNQSGQLLQMKNVSNAGGSTVALSVGTYPTGTYTIVVNGADGAKQVSNVLISK
jgi:hypothetical protein